MVGQTQSPVIHRGVTVTEYPDGSSYAEVPTVVPDVFYSREFTFRINSYNDLWHLHQIVDAFNSIGEVPLVTIPCLLDAQADRRFEEGQSFGLKLVLEFLAEMDAQFRIFHPHNPDLVEYVLPDAEVISNTEFIRSVIDDLIVNGGMKDDAEVIDNLILMSPDAGAFKPLMKLANDIGWEGETYSASKSRKFDGENSKLTQIVDREDFDGKDILIVDDLCVYGGTFKGLSKLLSNKNVGKLYLAVSHMTVQEIGNDPVSRYFDAVYTTNSKYPDYQSDGNTSWANINVIRLWEEV